jgi:hypothetical protein
VQVVGPSVNIRLRVGIVQLCFDQFGYPRNSFEIAKRKVQ